MALFGPISLNRVKQAYQDSLMNQKIKEFNDWWRKNRPGSAYKP